MSHTESRADVERIGEMLRAEEQMLDYDIDTSAKFAIDINADFQYDVGVDKKEEEGAHGLRQRLAAFRKRKDEAKDTDQDEAALIPFTLRGVKLEIPPGSLVCVVGRVGTGKTTLLSGMINEIRRTKGHVRFNGIISFGERICDGAD